MSTSLILKTGAAARAEIERLLEAVPAGLTADNMARISRLRLSSVEAELLALERAREAVRREIVFRGAPLTVWRSK